VLNAGYRAGAMVPRCNDKGELEEFKCFCPKAYAGLDTKMLAPALLSRSVTIRLAPKKATEVVEPWMGSLTAKLAAPVRDACAGWAWHHTDELRDAEPDLPAHLHNRSAEVWWALLAIADAIGGDWPARAREASRLLRAGGDQLDEKPNLVLLLSDIKDAFGTAGTIFTRDLLNKLNAVDESPWGGRREGAGLDARGLGRMLRPLGVKANRTVRIGSETAKGYLVESFADAFERYTPPESPKEPSQPSQPSQPSSRGTGDVTDVTDVTDKSGPPAGGMDGNLFDQIAAAYGACSCPDPEPVGQVCTTCGGAVR
jgi:hypothetical protein